jgi:ArsR family transcriptional regulator, arsenate/arsenite/antimonite-responsive transcriptional repressor
MATQFKEVFKALQDCNRRKILNVLKDGEQCANYILEKFDITQPTFSHHMKALNEAHLVNIRKDGLFTYYSLNKDMLNQIITYLNILVNEAKDETIPCVSCHDKNK